MSRMVDDLLSLAKIEGRESIKPNNQINIFQLLSNIQELFLARSKKNLIDFNTKQLTEIPNITGDFDELMEVSQNLIDNAIKYGEKVLQSSLKFFWLHIFRTLARKVSLFRFLIEVRVLLGNMLLV